MTSPASGDYAIQRRADGVHLRFLGVSGVESQDIPPPRYHSPTGFEYGYAGSGPADLALAILCHYFGAPRIAHLTTVAAKARGLEGSDAWRWHQDFKRRFIAGLDRRVSDHLLSVELIEQWLSIKRQAAAPPAETPDA